MANVCNRMLMPMAVMSGASLGLLRRGRYAIFSIVKLRHADTTLAITRAINSINHPGKPGIDSCIRPVTDQLVSAATMRTSPCAKLIKLMMP